MTQEQGDGYLRPWFPVGVWWLVAAWLVLAVATVVWAVPHAEEDLRSRTEDALADAGLSVSVDLDGRDATLSGTVDTIDGPERAEDAVRGVSGVRRIVNRIEVAAEPVPLRDPIVTMTLSGGRVTLQGLVPDQAVGTAIVAAAVGQYGADRVTNELVVADDVASPGWLGLIRDAVEQLEPLLSGTVVFDTSEVTLTGEVPSEDLRSSLQTSLELVFGDALAVTSRLTVATLASPTLQAESVDGRIELRGTMPDQESIDALVTGAIGVYGSDGVTSTLSIGEGTGKPEWLARLPELFNAAGGLDSWAATLEGGHLLVTGFGSSQNAADRAGSALGDLTLPGLELEVDVRLTPAAVAATLTALVADSVTFEAGTGALSSASTEVLDVAIEILLANPAAELTVEGHTEATGDPAASLAVSRERAETVIDYLVQGGVERARLTAIGYGESRPIADNVTAAGRDENRRIEFTVREGEG